MSRVKSFLGALLTIFFITTEICAVPFSANYLFSNITVEDGLPSNFIDDLYKDKYGFIWIATRSGGLLRYDGYEFTTFNNRSAFPIKSNYVRQVCEDDFNRLWIVSEGGIDILDLNYNNQSNNPKFDKYFNTPSIHITKDNKGSIWAVSVKNITKFNFDNDGNIVSVNTLKSDINIQGTVGNIYEYEDQMLVGINNTLYKIYANSQDELLISEYSPLLTNIDCRNIKCMVAKENELWIGTDGGLIRFNPISQSIKVYKYSPSDPNSVSQNLITDIKVDNSGILIVATLRGLNFYDTMNDHFKHVSHDENETEYCSINCDFINCLLCDDRTIWVGTESGGVNKMMRKRLAITNYVHSANNSNSISRCPVNAVYIDKKDNLWVGCVEGGLNLKTPNSNHWQHFTVDNGLTHNSISHIEPISDDIVWLAQWGGGINTFNIKTRRVEKTIVSTRSDINIDFVGTLAYDSINNGVWVGSTAGIYFYDLVTNQFSNPLSTDITNRVFGSLGRLITSNNHLLIGCTAGLVSIDLNSFKKDRNNFEHRIYKPTPDDPQSAYLNKITFLLQASNNNIWIGTDGYGLVKIDVFDNDTTIRAINVEDGLNNDIIYHILEDNTQKIWITTANGISCYSSSTGRIINYFKQDGLCDNQFFWNGCYKHEKSNKLYFGNICGLVEIDASSPNLTNAVNNILITKLVIDDKVIYPAIGKHIETAISQAKNIRMHERDKTFSLEFSALNYNTPTSILYQYRLLGFNDNWTTVSHLRRFATYTNIGAGTYTFQVRCATGPYNFSDPTEVTIVITPYFYKTWWFYSLALIIVVVAAYCITQRRLRTLKEQKDILEVKVQERTTDLKNKTEELSLQNEVLNQQNEEILQQKDKMEKLNHKIQELTVDKLAFFTNITHEFRTPLTLIIGPIDRALKLSTNPKVIEQLNFVSRNSKHLLSLVNQLMDFRKVESGNMPISLTPGNFATFMDDMLLPFYALAAEKNITLRYISRFSNAHFMFDREAMTKIITNLLGNAVKFTPDNGTINIYAATLSNSSKLYLCISDNGNGIVKDDIEKIFNRYYQSKNNEAKNLSGHSGTGIGLYLCKRLANLLGGDIYALNNHIHGAMFRVVLPIEVVDSEVICPFSTISDDEPDSIDDEITDDKNTHLTILVVEDNADMRSYIRSVLSDTFNILEAPSGKEALKLLRSHNINLVLSDFMMPEMDGLQLVKNIKKDINISHIPFIMLTAKTARNAQLESLHNGVDDYIIKPFDEDVLKAKINAVIENRRLLQLSFKNDMVAESLNISEDSSDKKFIDKALKIVKENYKNSYFEVADFVEAMGMSKTLLNKKMQNLIHQNTSQFIRNYRLKVARELIIKNRITKNMNISEIAYEVGFNDPKYFTRCFTKHFNTTPSSLFDYSNE